jgi:hypothetical protein
MSQTFTDWCFNILRRIVQVFSGGSRLDSSSDRPSVPQAIAVPQAAQSVVININTSAPTVIPPPTAAQGPSAPAQLPAPDVEPRGRGETRAESSAARQPAVEE